MFWNLDPATKSGEMLVKIPASGKNADADGCLLVVAPPTEGADSRPI